MYLKSDFIFYQFRVSILIVNYDSFYKDKTLEVDKISISDISKDLQIPKESARRKVGELERAGVIKKKGKKIFVDRTGFTRTQANLTLKNMTTLLYEFNKILEEEKIIKIAYQSKEILDSIKKNFSFVWYQFYKFLFIFTNRWRKELGDLETFTIGVIVLINAAENKNFKIKEFDRKKYSISIQGSDERGVNAMSLAEITGIPRATVVRKLEFLIKNKFLNISEKKLYTFGIGVQSKQFKVISKLQDRNMNALSKFLYMVLTKLKLLILN